MSEHAPDRLWSGIDVPKTIAGVLAAVTAAVIGSFLGAAGTLAGAALASVVGSVGTEIYRQLVHRGKQKIVSTFVTAPAAVGTPSVAAAIDESPSQPEPEASQPSVTETPRKMRWGRVAVVAASVFVVAMGVLTAFESISGKTAADAVTGGHSGSTSTIARLLSNNEKKKPAPAPTTTPSATTPTSDAPSQAPNVGETPTSAPATTDGSTPSEPAAPTETSTPEPTATDTQNPDGGNDQQNIAPPPTQQSQGTE